MQILNIELVNCGKLLLIFLNAAIVQILFSHQEKGV
jgi:hypothetical protein